MRKIDFIGIGFPRCGSTFLADALNQHSEIWLHPEKELNYFNDKLAFNFNSKGIEGYEYLFSIAPRNKKIGEFSPTYIYDFHALGRIAGFFPDVKVIICERNKIDMALSLMYVYFKRYKKEITPEEVKDMINFEKYKEFVYKVFKKKNVLVVNLEDLKTNFPVTMMKVFKFLEVPHEKINVEKLNKNKSADNQFRSPFLSYISCKLKSIKMHPRYKKKAESDIIIEGKRKKGVCIGCGKKAKNELCGECEGEIIKIKDILLGGAE